MISMTVSSRTLHQRPRDVMPARPADPRWPRTEYSRSRYMFPQDVE